MAGVTISPPQPRPTKMLYDPLTLRKVRRVHVQLKTEEALARWLRWSEHCLHTLTKVADSISGQGTLKKQPMNA